jgi:hypothetical protein
LYFAVLDRPVSPRGAARREELEYALEAAVPRPVDTVHAVFAPLPDGRVVAVGIDRDQALQLGRSCPQATPAEWPSWLLPLVGSLDPHDCNLLTGPCRSPLSRAAWRSVAAHTLVGLSVLSTLAVAGLERQIRHESDLAAEHSALAQSIYSDALGGAGSPSQPAAARMTSELRRLRATRNSSPDRADGQPADLVLAALLKGWPDLNAKTESITVAERAVDVQIIVDDLDAAQTFIQAFGGASGLRLGPTTTDRQPDGVRLSVRLDREDQP